MSILSSVEATRRAARHEAEAVLQEHGFERLTENEWRGALYLQGTDATISARVQIPNDFPDKLPEVYVDREDLPRRIAHHEGSGKICIAPNTGVLLDASRPKALISYALTRAAREVSRGLTGESDSDLQTEFLAYWVPTIAARTYSLCDALGPTRTIVKINLQRGIGEITNGTTLLADSIEEAQTWAERLGTKGNYIGDALFLKLRAPFAPPEFERSVSLADVRSVIQECATAADADVFRSWLRSTSLSATVLLSLPETQKGTGPTLIGIRVNNPSGNLEKRNRAGFRPGHVPVERTLSIVGSSPVDRLNLVRVDRAFIAARGGAAETLARKTVVMIGAGAVGSQVGVQLAALGVGTLRIIDPEFLGPENVHRHALGMRSVWQSKALALSADLASRFPHLKFEPRHARIEEVLETEPEFVTNADLALMATGDETLERRLNRILHGHLPRVHTWVEPLGIGGHAFACGSILGGSGCFECLFEVDPVLGPVNRAALTAPGQKIQRSLAGCVGTFSPFSVLDAKRTAVEATELSARFLSGELDDGALVTWHGSNTSFEAEGLEKSRRAHVICPGEKSHIQAVTLARAECPVCGGQNS